MINDISIPNFQEGQALQEQEPQNEDFAVVSEIFPDGVVLTFGKGTSQEQTTNKAYQTNSAVKLNVGDKVKLDKISGSYIVAYPLGSPKTVEKVDHAETSETANNSLKLNGKEASELSVNDANTCYTAEELRSDDGRNIWIRFRKEGSRLQIGYGGNWYNLVTD